jgi:hypothetical protein
MKCLAPLVLASLALPAVAMADDMLSAEALVDYVQGKAYEGINPETGAKVASVVYHSDGSSTLWMAAEGSPDEPGSYRFEGNAYCTRYKNFRDNAENCFTLAPLADGQTQAWYTDGRMALILNPIEIPERFK